jgi:hypothetical protein
MLDAELLAFELHSLLSLVGIRACAVDHRLGDCV